MRPKSHRRSAFTLIELVVVILILAILAGVLVPRVTDRLASARDARRINDMRVIRDAIEQYKLDKGSYPPATVGAGASYDLSTDGAFIQELVDTGYLREPPRDPLNDATYYYGYNVLAEGTGGCKGKGSFYVLGIKTFENPGFAAEHPGYFKCASKDWNSDFEYVTGGGASAK